MTTEQRRQITVLRGERRSFSAIARTLGMPHSTVARHGKALGVGRLATLEAKPAIVRYERQRPGEMIHIDIKKLARIDGVGHRISGDRTQGRGKGWEYLHLAVDDHSRIAYSAILPDETACSCVKFLFQALRFFRDLGIAVERVMTDNGVGFRARAYARALRRLHIAHKRTRPYTPRTNGKAERFVQTSLREWAYARPYEHSAERSLALQPFLHHYNHHRPHFGIRCQTPISRLPVSNLSRHDI